MSSNPGPPNSLDLIGSIPLAVVILDAADRILTLNTVARRCINQCQEKSFPFSFLCGSESEAARLAKAIDSVRKTGRPALFRGHSAIWRDPVSVLVNSPERFGFEAREGSVVIIMSAPELHHVNFQALRHLFNFTPSEARLASVMMHGRTVREAAAALKLTPHSVRTYLKVLFQKTGTRRQCELQYVLLSAPLHFFGPEP